MPSYYEQLIGLTEERKQERTSINKKLFDVHSKVFSTIAPEEGKDDWRRQLIRDIPYARVFTDWGREELWDSSETMLGMPKELAKEHVKAGLFYFGGPLLKMGAKALPFANYAAKTFIATHKTASEALSLFGAGLAYGMVDPQKDESALKTAGQWAIMPPIGRALSPVGRWTIGKLKTPVWKIGGAFGRNSNTANQAAQWMEQIFLPTMQRIEKRAPEVAKAFRQFQTDLHVSHEDMYKLFKPIADKFGEKYNEPFFMMMTKSMKPGELNELRKVYGITDDMFKMMQISAKNVRDTYLVAGQESVKRGLLNLKTFKENMHKYFPAMTAYDDPHWSKFIKDTAGLSAKSKATKAKAAMTHFMKSKMQQMTPEERVEFGQVMDFAFVGFKSLNTIKRDIAFYDLTEKLAKYSKWVIPSKLVKETKKNILGWNWRVLPKRFIQKFELEDTVWTHTAITPGFRNAILHWEKNGQLNSARQVKILLENQRAKHGISKTSKKFMFVQEQGSVAEEIAEYAGKGFRQLDRDPKLMNLSGRYVHPLIERELEEMLVKADVGDFMKVYMKGMQKWKGFKTIWQPAMHFRNMISNVFLNHLGGLPFWRTDVYIRAGKGMPSKIFGRKGSAEFREALENGLFRQSLVSDELGIMTRQIVGAGKTQGPIKGFFGKYLNKRFNQIESKLGHWFEQEEHLAKFAKYLYNKEELGMTPLDAANDAMKWTFNYNELPKTIKGIRKFVPFVTFPYKATQVTAEALVNTPWRIHSIVYPMIGFAHANIGAMGMTEENFDDLYRQLPEYMQKGRFFLLPWKDEQGRMQWFDAGYMLPWGDIVNGENELDMKALMKQNPFVAIMEDIRRNRDWIDRPIWNSWDEPEIKTYKMVEHMWTAIMPNAVGRDIQNLVESVNQVDPKARSLTQLGMGTVFGTKVTPRTERQIRIDATKRKLAKRMELRRWLKREMGKKPDAEERIELHENYRSALRDILKRG